MKVHNHLHVRDLTRTQAVEIVEYVNQWENVQVTDLGPMTFTREATVTYRLDLKRLTCRQLLKVAQLLESMTQVREHLI